MASSGSCFRVLRESNTKVRGEPSFVIFRMDPATLGFTDIVGNPEQLLGFPARDWFRQHFWSERVHPDDREAARVFFAGWSSASRDEQLEYRVIDSAGHTVWVHQIICVARDARQELTICGVVIDITERMSRETDVETAMFVKSELFRMIIEDLAPPVRAISVYGDMLGRHLSAQGDDVGSDYAVGLRDGLERLDTTLAQLMRLAQSAGASSDQINGSIGALHRGSPVG